MNEDMQLAASHPLTIYVSLDGSIVYRLSPDVMPLGMKRGQRKLLIALLEHFIEELGRGEDP